MPRPSARAARRGLHGEGSTATAAWRGEASEGRRFTRNRVHRAAGVGVPGLPDAIHVMVSAGHRFTVSNTIEKRVLPVNRCPVGHLILSATATPGTPAPAARCTRLRVNLRPADACPRRDRRTSCHRRGIRTCHPSISCHGSSFTDGGNDREKCPPVLLV